MARPPDPPQALSLSSVEFIGAAASATRHGLEGGSEAVTRLRERVSATGAAGFAAAIVCGAAGTGRLRVARSLHASSRRAGAPLLVVDAGDDGCALALARIVRSLEHEPTTLPGNVVIRALERGGEATVAAATSLLTAQGLQLRCGLILVTAEPPAALRSRSLEHGHLFSRCGRAIVHVPSLAARLADVPMLAKSLLRDSVAHYGKPVRGISPQALGALQRHDYPGNVRELAGMIDQAVLATHSDWLTVEDFPRLAVEEGPSRRGELTIRLPGSSLREIELQALRLALRLTDGRIVRAAELLGITRHALRRKLDKHGLNDLRAGTDGEDRADDDAFI